MLTYQADDERSCDDYVCKACGQEPYESRYVLFWLFYQVFENDNIHCVPDTAACLSPARWSDDTGVFVKWTCLGRRTRGVQWESVSIYYLWVALSSTQRIFVSGLRQQPAANMVSLAIHFIIAALPTMTRGSSATSQCAVLVFVNRHSHQKQTLCMRPFSSESLERSCTYVLENMSSQQMFLMCGKIRWRRSYEFFDTDQIVESKAHKW
jgi:hypothetical protein